MTDTNEQTHGQSGPKGEQQRVVSCHAVGIKCDSLECDYRDDSVTFENYDDWLNKPCPKCGANLLTEVDLNAVKMMMAAADWINSLGIPRGDESEEITIPIEFNGTGQINIGDIKAS
mgnify:CR=1 FL=1